MQLKVALPVPPRTNATSEFPSPESPPVPVHVTLALLVPEVTVQVMLLPCFKWTLDPSATGTASAVNSASTPTKIRDFRYGTSYYLLLAMPGIAAAEQKLRGISFRRSQDCA